MAKSDLSKLAPLLPSPEAWVDTLGRWTPKRGEVYVRTARLRMENMEEAVAAKRVVRGVR